MRLFQSSIWSSPVWIFFILTIIRISLVKFGMPFILHPDEPYILKDPFKIVNNYSNFIFNNPFNLTYYFHLIWYGLLFILGYCSIGSSSSGDLKNQLIQLEENANAKLQSVNSATERRNNLVPELLKTVNGAGNRNLLNDIEKLQSKNRKCRRQ